MGQGKQDALQVSKSNRLVEAGFKLTLNEQRLLLLAVSKLNPVGPAMPEGFLVTIEAADFSDVFDVPLKQSYEALQDATERMYERDIQTRKGNMVHRMRWVSEVKYWTGEGRATLAFSPQVTPYLTRLKSEFTHYRLAQVAPLSSVYSIRLFEMLMQWRTTGHLTISVEDLRTRLQLETKYSRYTEIRRHVIMPAVAELQEKCNLQIDWRALRVGKKVDRLAFDFKEADQLALSL